MYKQLLIVYFSLILKSFLYMLITLADLKKSLIWKEYDIVVK